MTEQDAMIVLEAHLKWLEGAGNRWIDASAIKWVLFNLGKRAAKEALPATPDHPSIGELRLRVMAIVNDLEREIAKAKDEIGHEFARAVIEKAESILKERGAPCEAVSRNPHA